MSMCCVFIGMTVDGITVKVIQLSVAFKRIIMQVSKENSEYGRENFKPNSLLSLVIQQLMYCIYS